MEVFIDDKALKDLKKISKSDATKILSKIELLKFYPEIPNIKKLKNFKPPYRLRVGNYRVLFDINNEIVIVYSIKHRKESYK